MKLEFFRQISEKCSNTKFHENPSSGNLVLSCGRKGRLDEANHPLCRFARTLEMDDVLKKLKVAYKDMTQFGLAVAQAYLRFG
jgi:hypothetical protein